MPALIALFTGINIGSTLMLSMKALTARSERAGFDGVRACA